MPGENGKPVCQTMLTFGSTRVVGYGTGWKQMACERNAVAAACAKIQGQITSCASSLAQAAGVAALGLAPDALDADVEVFRGRRDRVLSDLGEIAAAKGRVAVPPAPGGAFYVFFDVSGCLGLRAPDGAQIATSTQFCESLLAHRKLALVPTELTKLIRSAAAVWAPSTRPTTKTTRIPTWR